MVGGWGGQRGEKGKGPGVSLARNQNGKDNGNSKEGMKLFTLRDCRADDYCSQNGGEDNRTVPNTLGGGGLGGRLVVLRTPLSPGRTEQGEKIKSIRRPRPDRVSLW